MSDITDDEQTTDTDSSGRGDSDMHDDRNRDTREREQANEVDARGSARSPSEDRQSTDEPTQSAPDGPGGQERQAYRRTIMSAVGTGTIASLAGCGYLFGDGNQESPTPSATPERVTTNEVSPLGSIRKRHAEYVADSGVQTNLAAFSYDQVQVSEGDAQLIAAPLADVDGDRAIIQPKTADADRLQALRRTLVASFGAPVDAALDPVTVFGGEVTFRGGSGEVTHAAGAVTEVPELGSAVLLARGQDIDALRTAMAAVDTLEL